MDVHKGAAKAHHREIKPPVYETMPEFSINKPNWYRTLVLLTDCTNATQIHSLGQRSKMMFHKRSRVSNIWSNLRGEREEYYRMVQM